MGSVDVKSSMRLMSFDVHFLVERRRPEWGKEKGGERPVEVGCRTEMTKFLSEIDAPESTTSYI